jgi:hypothetical protein
LEESSEKGCSRKTTENRVTSWGFIFWGNYGILRCFAKRILLEEFNLAVFRDCGRWTHVEGGGGGTISVFWGWGKLLGYCTVACTMGGMWS